MSDLTALRARSTEVQLDVAAQRVSFGAGLYLITLTGVGALKVDGLALPCVRIDPLPPSPERPGRAYLASLSEGQWLNSSNQSAFLRIEGGSANLILTTYNVSGDAPSPKVRIRLVKDAEEAASVVAAPAPKRPELMPPGALEDTLPLTLLVHCSGIGDLTVPGGQWAGAADPRFAIEAFSLAPVGLEGDVALEYQSIMGVDWSSPWVASPELSGSRGLALPLFGMRGRFVGADADQYELVMWARSGDRELGPTTAGELDGGPDVPISALKVALRRKVKEKPRPQPPRMTPRRGRALA